MKLKYVAPQLVVWGTLMTITPAEAQVCTPGQKLPEHQVCGPGGYPERAGAYCDNHPASCNIPVYDPGPKYYQKTPDTINQYS